MFFSQLIFLSKINKSSISNINAIDAKIGNNSDDALYLTVLSFDLDKLPN